MQVLSDCLNLHANHTDRGFSYVSDSSRVFTQQVGLNPDLFLLKTASLLKMKVIKNRSNKMMKTHIISFRSVYSVVFTTESQRKCQKSESNTINLYVRFFM